ncbi:hypothetical protein ACFY4B_27275 [Kitasatospora sp. NPDC001261]|uniref:hypothetical protein n=1 Tax=Kitasatospora sp. NPDC001261 TaxID=3364012 RepID=UPI0036B7181B
MGAVDFTAYQDGTDAAKAFRDAIEEARYQYGNRPYTGTLAEKDDFQVITDTPLSMDDAEALAGRIMSDDRHPVQDKYGPAGAIPVLTDQRTVTVTIPATAQGYRTTEEAALTVLADEGRLLPGETVGYCITGIYSHCPRTGRIRSGDLTVPLQGGPPEHRGWLFFGLASY